ncbi:MAG: hypothetical protein WBG38_02765 [Nodosilinea sp.]
MRSQRLVGLALLQFRGAKGGAGEAAIAPFATLFWCCSGCSNRIPTVRGTREGSSDRNLPEGFTAALRGLAVESELGQPVRPAAIPDLL